MKSNKKHIGTVCDHHEDILVDGDAYCVECSDGLCDICERCFNKYTEIHNADTLKECDKSPYNGNESSYWFDGTIKDLRTYIGN